MWRRLLIVILIGLPYICLFFGGVIEGGSSFHLYPVIKNINLSEDPDLLEAAVLGQVPIGISVAKAKILMEVNGFKCEVKTAETYSVYRDHKDGRQAVSERHNVDFLDCKFKYSDVVCNTTWQSLIEYQHLTVTKVSANTDWVCL